LLIDRGTKIDIYLLMLLSSDVGKCVVALCHSTLLEFGYNVPSFSGEKNFKFMETLECKRVAWHLVLLLAVFEETE